jgi:hypothetical protein
MHDDLAVVIADEATCPPKLEGESSPELRKQSAWSLIAFPTER